MAQIWYTDTFLDSFRLADKIRKRLLRRRNYKGVKRCRLQNSLVFFVGHTNARGLETKGLERVLIRRMRLGRDAFGVKREKFSKVKQITSKLRL